MKTRKLLALVLAIAMLASFVSVPVFAEDEGTALETLGILIGPDADGVTEAYLATTATRAQAALIDLRLEGNEAAALAFDGEETFTDAADATAFWQPVLEFLKATPASGWNGYEDGTFLPNAAITGMEFTKILLVSLGYVEGVDFMYADVMDMAATVGLTALEDKADDDLIVEDLAVAIMEALGTKTNSVTDVTLLSQLVIDGVIDAADAVAAGFVVEEEALVIVAAYASAINEVTVEMSIDVPGDAVVTLKKGTAAYNVDEAVVDNTITLTALFNLPAGTYTVAVDDETAEFVVVARHAVDLAIGVDTIYDAGAQDLKVQLLDQYGDAMSLSGTNYSVFNQTTGYVFTPAVSTTLKITPDTVVSGTTVAAKAGAEVYIFVYDPTSMLTVSGTVVVREAPYIAGLEIGGVTLGKIGTVVQTTLFQSTLANVLDVTAVDQYGNAFILSSTDVTTGTTYANKVQVLSSNSAIIDPAAVVATGPNAAGDLVFDALSAGTVMITLVIPDQAVIVTSELITVYATPVLTSAMTSGPDEALYDNEATTFAVAGLDQYGNVMAVPVGALTFTATVDIFGTPSAVSASNVIGFTPDDAGNSTVYYFLNGIFQGTFDVTVNAAAYPFQITGVKAPGGLEEGTEDSIVAADLTVIDQYGRTYTTNPFTGTYDFKVVSKAALVGFTLTEVPSPHSFTVATIDDDKDTKAETFVASITVGGTSQAVSAYQFTYTLVESEDIDGFAITPITGTMYTGSTFDLGQVSPAAANYYKTAVVTGKYGEMAVVLVDTTPADGVPDVLDVITASGGINVVGNELRATAAVDGTTTVMAWQNGVAVAAAEVTLSKTAPDCVTVKEKAKNTAAPGAFASMFTYKDQYGVALTYDALNASRSGDVPVTYFSTDSWLVGTTVRAYNIVKWDGSITATYLDTID